MLHLSGFRSPEELVRGQDGKHGADENDLSRQHRTPAIASTELQGVVGHLLAPRHDSKQLREWVGLTG